MKIRELIVNPQFKYIYITFLISAIGFLKSFILLNFFDFDKLGIVALAQTFTSTISLMQIGVVTGGYRLFAYKRESVLKKINATVLFFFLFLTALLCTLGCFVCYFFDIGVSFLFCQLFILIGILSLYSNWVICKLLGTKNIKIVNKAQAVSAIISFLVTLCAYWFGLTAVLIALFLQPLIIIIVAYWFLPSMIPTINFKSFKKYIKKIIWLGFIPYLTSALALLNSQFGRWLITFSLGTVILGKTFLPALFVVLVSVFPGAISSLFFPKIIENFELNKKENLLKTLKNYFAILIIYYLLIMIATFLLANSLIKIFLPKHMESITLIYAALPSVLFIHLSGPAIFLFNAMKKFNNILIGGLISVISYCSILSLYLYFSKPQLIWFFIIESISAALFFIYNTYFFIKLNKSLDYAN
ncbi:hypothetical protein JI750_18325 [Flavobacterium sp. GN10]|uniref:Membrane protein involved in the export of O-antigen and teichoic acid n=1 Tax=Flavobacterium tagetis TaxID=2801336 RepID=A0ABS1KHA5_9FLAO|nr:hypothetical protein [Flavobacterium tagetis]MBL0738858.1 hypothetical protein [Flavobacterium tagetis]